jgi:hypothetical protein
MLMSQVVGVFDFVPDNAQFPYVQIGEFTTAPFQTFDRYGQEVTLTLHVWAQQTAPNAYAPTNQTVPSAYQGMKQIEFIMDSVQRLLARSEFYIEGWGNVGCWGDFSTTMQLSDGITRHGILRYRIKVLDNFPPS